MKGQHLRRYGAEARSGNDIAPESGARGLTTGVDNCAGRIVDGSWPLTEIALQHSRRGQRVEAGQLSAANEELVERDEPECTVAPVVQLGNDDRAAYRETEFVLRAMG